MLNTTVELIEAISRGEMVILVDDETRENEGDLVIAADAVSPEVINFMAKEARGLICLSLPSEQIERLKLPLMVKEDHNQSLNRTAFTVSIEAANGVGTGISAADRAHTIRTAAAPNARPEDVIVPGHVFPIRAQDGGVLKRAGHTEASVDLARLAGRVPAAVICEIMNPDGTMARMPQLLEFAKAHGLKLGTIESLIEYRLHNETFVHQINQKPFPMPYGSGFTARVFRNSLDGDEHLALVKGKIDPDRPTLVRVHTESLMGDVFADAEDPSRQRLKSAIRAIDEAGEGVFVYLCGTRAHRLSSQGKEDSQTAENTFRDYGIGAQILRQVGAGKIRLLTNSLSKPVAIRGYGIEIVETLPLPTTAMETL